MYLVNNCNKLSTQLLLVEWLFSLFSGLVIELTMYALSYGVRLFQYQVKWFANRGLLNLLDNFRRLCTTSRNALLKPLYMHIND